MAVGFNLACHHGVTLVDGRSVIGNAVVGAPFSVSTVDRVELLTALIRLQRRRCHAVAREATSTLTIPPLHLARRRQQRTALPSDRRQPTAISTNGMGHIVSPHVPASQAARVSATLPRSTPR